MLKKAFTLIELLVVIGIMAVLTAGVVALINPVEKARQANDAKVQNDVAQLVGAVQSFSAQQSDGSFPCVAVAAACPNSQAGQNMATNAFNAIGPAGTGELTTMPAPPTGSNYYYFASAAARPVGNFVIYGRYVSAKYNTATCAAATPQGYAYYDSRNGRTCGICLAAAPAAFPAAAGVCTF